VVFCFQVCDNRTHECLCHCRHFRETADEAVSCSMGFAVWDVHFQTKIMSLPCFVQQVTSYCWCWCVDRVLYFGLRGVTLGRSMPVVVTRASLKKQNSQVLLTLCLTTFLISGKKLHPLTVVPNSSSQRDLTHCFWIVLLISVILFSGHSFEVSVIGIGILQIISPLAHYSVWSATCSPPKFCL
jgi:hypothetical protein